MAERGDNNFIRYIYRGEEGEIIPRGATHITVHKDCTFIRAQAFQEHPNVVEVICHEGVERIEWQAFVKCPRLIRVIMPGVKNVDVQAFVECKALTYVECSMLEIIGDGAFGACISLGNANLPSARIVEIYAFSGCTALMDVKFGRELERIEEKVFYGCTSLERITFPLKDCLITEANIFTRCENLKHVDLVETAELYETIAALHLEEWRNDMNTEIDSINQILLNARAGDGWDDDSDDDDDGEKARAIRIWIRSVLQKIIQYQEEHQRSLDGAAATLQFLLPRYVTFDLILPFLELPAHTFELGEGDDE